MIVSAFCCQLRRWITTEADMALVTQMKIT
jgi:hypothetical protein